MRRTAHWLLRSHDPNLRKDIDPQITSVFGNLTTCGESSSLLHRHFQLQSMTQSLTVVCLHPCSFGIRRIQTHERFTTMLL
ncbi:uncharacterized protein LOC114253723 isoform X2 [Monomorium pharaonis]|uniref:uncharacterized protein LOC114253723 isoform X2 n=1 Tax=Monomorium pharaonis TaxID=307658 RepID=UPI00102E105A|nr:uncharacterized protein LOC114253723 isoform X2 [Monomorium pharaonis]